MSNSIFIHPSLEFQNILGINLKVYASSDAIFKASAKEAIELLEVLSHVDLIITMDKIGTEDTAKQVYLWLKQQALETPIIVMSEDKSNFEYGRVIAPDCDMKEIVKLATQLIGITNVEHNKKLASEFFPISLAYFQFLETAICDIYQRSGSGDKGEFIYYKIFEQNKKISKSEMEKLQKNGTKNLFIISGLRLKFTNYFTTILLKKIQGKSTAEAKMVSLEAARTIIAQEIKSFGIKEDTVKVADAIISESLKLIEKDKSFKNYIKNLLTNTSSYIYQHSQILTYVSFQMIDNMEWGTTEQKQKMAFIAFFHDIVLTDDRLAQIHNEGDALEANLELSEKEIVRKHAYEASILIQKYPGAPIGADVIIKQHHGTHNGIWFKNPPNHDMSPLTVVFMVAEEFTSYYMKNKTHFDFKAALEFLNKHFPNHNKFSTVIEALGKGKLTT
ncbi:MAG: hypothetical protein JNM93_07845 [Bacteriovoracaceae bacterium]|nr:hypothetical protein [Bacteriovoracaceae bacterium]